MPNLPVRNPARERGSDEFKLVGPRPFHEQSPCGPLQPNASWHAAAGSSVEGGVMKTSEPLLQHQNGGYGPAVSGAQGRAGDFQSRAIFPFRGPHLNCH